MHAFHTLNQNQIVVLKRIANMGIVERNQGNHMMPLANRYYRLAIKRYRLNPDEATLPAFFKFLKEEKNLLCLECGFFHPKRAKHKPYVF